MALAQLDERWRSPLRFMGKSIIPACAAIPKEPPLILQERVTETPWVCFMPITSYRQIATSRGNFSPVRHLHEHLKGAPVLSLVKSPAGSAPTGFAHEGQTAEYENITWDRPNWFQNSAPEHMLCAKPWGYDMTSFGDSGVEGTRCTDLFTADVRQPS